MRFVWATARKDLRRRRNDPVALLLWIGIPIVVGGILSLLAGGREGPSPQAYVLVADEDDSFVSGLLIGALSQERTGSFLRAERVDVEAGRKRIAKGDATALLTIPRGFGEAVLEETPATLSLVTNPAQRILPSMVEEALGAFGEIVFYAHRVFGSELREIAAADSTLPEARVADLSVRIQRAVNRLSDTLFPPVIELTVVGPAERAAAADSLAASGGEPAEPEPSFALLFVPGLLFMSLLFLASGVAEDFWVEREAHTLRRAAVAPPRALALLAGKLLAGAALMLLVCAVALAVAWSYFGLGWERWPGAVIWAAFSGAVLLLLFVTLHLHLPTRRGASVLAAALVFPLMMLGGSFFPFEAMPDWMVAIGQWTPNGWALTRLKDILLDRAEPAALTRSSAALLAFGAVLFLVSARRLGAFARA